MSQINAIQFLLDGKLHSLDFSSEGEMKPSTTVLNYLRSLDHHKGVKEGCAEGDCGACTVVVAEAQANGNLIYKALDSCLVFMPMIHGKQLITVEDLKHQKEMDGVLHPVQELMVTENGSQCGYCTPGFIMSMFALYKSHYKPDKEVVLDALTGNLCRCTGYQPIVKAAQKACCHDGKDHFSPKEKDVWQALMEIRQESVDMEFNIAGQKYFLPVSLQKALQIREEHPDAIVVSGGTDIALRQTKKNEHLTKILDLTSIQELKEVQIHSETMKIGSCASLEEVKKQIKDILPALYEMLVVFGSLQIRNMATLGGNVGSASPIGDTLPLLFAYNAKIQLINANHIRRNISIEEFIIDYRKTDIQNNELIESINIPIPDRNTIVRSYKISRRKDLDISTVSAAFSSVVEKGYVKKILIAYGGMAAKTQRALQTEAFLIGKKWSLDTVLEAMPIVESEFTPLSDARSSAQARKIAASNVLLKFYHQNSAL